MLSVEINFSFLSCVFLRHILSTVVSSALSRILELTSQVSPFSCYILRLLLRQSQLRQRISDSPSMLICE